MKDEYIFPEAWYLRLDNDNIDIINRWRKEQHGMPECTYLYVGYDGWGLSEKEDGWEEIDTKLFKKCVLGMELDDNGDIVEVIEEDLTYLIQLFKDLNIK